MITTDDIRLLERHGTLGICTSPPRDIRILDGTYEDARKEFYVNIKYAPTMTYCYANGIRADGSIVLDHLNEVAVCLLHLPRVREVSG